MSDRSVLITGASRGLGRALSLAFARRGQRLVLCARGAAGIERVADEVRGAGSECLARAIDVTDADAIGALVADAEARWGPLDVLVNNASLLGPRAPLRDHDPAAWRETLDVNLTGAWLAARAVLPGMRRAGRGSIINVTSSVGDEPRAGWGVYAVSKWALEGLTWNLALEEAGSGIRVNAVNPGGMRTAMRRAAYPEEDALRSPEPAEVVDVFLWLASDAAAGVTGRRFDAREWRGPPPS
ncbi:MAG TPA: SDR family oxidoreductase [Longimicrobiales bacterium]|nr:SDR family oxidoreductase [Longimicrobiales bacterium]